MRVLRDVCLEPVRCNQKGFDPVHFRRRGPGDARASYRRGLTAMLLARHVETFDWTNYAHWMELCLRFYLAASLRRDALARARGLAGASARALATLVLPQVDARARAAGARACPRCGRAARTPRCSSRPRARRRPRPRARSTSRAARARARVLYCADVRRGDACFGRR